MPEALRLGAVILAAGGSTRMGSPKQLLPLGGRPLLLRAVEATLASGAQPVIVVLGAEAVRLRPLLSGHPVVVAENPQWSEGMASSLRAGVSRLIEVSPATDAAVIVLCDQPHFSSGSIRRLVDAQRATGRSIAAARYGGRNGAPALFRREHFSALWKCRNSRPTSIPRQTMPPSGPGRHNSPAPRTVTPQRPKNLASPGGARRRVRTLAPTVFATRNCDPARPLPALSPCRVPGSSGWRPCGPPGRWSPARRSPGRCAPTARPWRRHRAC